MTITIRPAKLADERVVLDLAVESVSRDPLPVTISRPAMSETFRALVGQPHHFAWVAEQDGQVVASVVAQSMPGFWFTRQQASVLLYYGRVTGSVVPLLVQFARWVKSRPVIRLAVFELEPGVDPRLVRLLTRLGFARQSANLTYVRGL
jgi:hypothetical protein